MKREMKPATALRRARALIEKGWTKRALARSKDGTSVPPESRAAVCWCALGAVDRASRGHFDVRRTAYSFLFEAGGKYRAVSEFNDAKRRTQEQVLRLFDRAIALAEAESR